MAEDLQGEVDLARIEQLARGAGSEDVRTLAYALLNARDRIAAAHGRAEDLEARLASVYDETVRQVSELRGRVQALEARPAPSEPTAPPVS